ncbi:MAG: hypothetical protein ACRD2S_04460 [Terriglobales bacterium]
MSFSPGLGPGIRKLALRLNATSVAGLPTLFDPKPQRKTRWADGKAGCSSKTRISKYPSMLPRFK